MKRQGYIFKKVYDNENIKTAIMKSSLGKRNRSFVKKVIDDIDNSAEEIKQMLVNRTYEHSPYTIKVIRDGPRQKERQIFKPRYYPDQIVHWALMLQLHEIFMHGMYEYSCGSIPGRGTS